MMLDFHVAAHATMRVVVVVDAFLLFFLRDPS